MKSTRLLWRAAVLCLAGALASLSALACNRSQPSVTAEEPPWFEDATEASKLEFVHDAGPTGDYYFPQIMGSGAALLDIDNDGRLDLYLIQNGGPKSQARNRLYRQRSDGTFEDVSSGSGLDVAGQGMGVAVGDVNNDGRPDVLLTEYRGIRLFLNQGDRTFREATREAGLKTLHWPTSAAFVDYDGDGWLDLVVTHYVDYDPTQRCTGSAARQDYCHPVVFPNAPTQLYRNVGKGVFKDATLESGLATKSGPGLGVICADFDGDGWADLFIANDGKPNHLWINQKNGTFVEEALSRGCARNSAGRAEGNMGVVFGDVDGDGLPDLFVTHLSEETNTLWRQGPVGLFRDRTHSAKLDSPRWRGTGFGVTLADFDNDGHLDLAVVNGRVARPAGQAEAGFSWSSYSERNQLFANSGAGSFRDRSPAEAAFCGTARIGRGLCAGDLSNRGRVDLLATNVNGAARLFRNVSPAPGHWLGVRAMLPELQRDAVGATVTVSAGERRWVRLIQSGGSYLSSGDPRAHFGLGAVERIDSIRVIWPDRTVEEFPGGVADRHLTLKRGEGKSKPK